MNIDYQIKKLVVDECACYSPFLNGIVYVKNKPQSVITKDYCDKEKEDCRCFIFKGKTCRYFEKAVLPMNPQLEVFYMAEHRIVEGKSLITGKVQIYCKKCRETFLADNYRSQYCDKCREYLNRKRWRESKSKKRQNVHNQLSETVDT